MIVSPALVKAYPSVAIWICDNLPKVKDKARVFKAFQRYARLDEKVAVRALKHGDPPTIEYRHMGSNGFFTDEYPNVVFIADRICRKFVSAKEHAANPKMHLLLESTLLHEIVHWGEFHSGKPLHAEGGKEFEKDAYGYDIGPYWENTGG
jgi:hypothetical protein